MQTDPKGGKAPAGGFKDLGWYNGYQYYQGSFAPQAGMIHPNSPQAGAGQAVSQEVNRQTSVAAGKAPDANQNFVNQQNATPNVVPQSVATPATTSYSGATAAGGGDGSIGGAGVGIAPPATLDLPKLYDSLYTSSGIKDLQDQYAAQQKALTEAKGAINDNPFLSEATRVGRVAKLESLFQERTANIKNDIATKTADIQMKLDLQTKQFDINSQSATQALNQFNALLSAGALDNASGEDIANITRATGLSSQAIQSAVSANKKKNQQTSVVQYDDGTNQGFAVIDTQTGNIISRQVVAASKPPAAGATGTSLLNDQRQIELDQKQAPGYATQAAKAGKTLDDMMATFQQYGMSPQEIYNIYIAVNYYKNTPAQIKVAKKQYGLK